MGDLVAVVVAVTLVPKDGLDLLHRVLSAGIQLKQLSNHFCLFFVNHQPTFILDIAKDTVVAQHHLVLDGLLMAELDTAGKLTKLVLRNTGHNGQPQLRIVIEGVDVVVLEKHPHAATQKLTGVLNGVQGVTGKTGDLFGDDQIEHPCSGIIHHPVEILPLLCGNAGKTFINIAGNEGPVGIALDQILIIRDLVAQRVQLFVTLRGYAGVVSYPQRDIINRFDSQCLTHAMYIHSFLLYIFVLSCLFLL